MSVLGLSIGIGLGLFGVGATLYGIAKSFDGPSWQGPPSDHFDGRSFKNAGSVAPHGPTDLARWARSRHRGPWRYRAQAPFGAKPPERVTGSALRVTFVNHSTVLVQTAGINVLTDPIWSNRASPVSWTGPRRMRPPGLRFEDLPPIDVVIISHNHYDHLDLPTLRQLQATHTPLFLVPLGNGKWLEQQLGGRVLELDWWESHDIGADLRAHCVPAQHFANRGLMDRDRTLWCGFLLESSAGSIYFAGDTGMSPHYATIAARFAPIRLALLPIGCYLPRWFMSVVHQSPAEAVEATRILGAAVSVGIHHGTFPLGDDGEDEPAHDLAVALDALEGPRPAFWVLEPGEGRDVPAVLKRRVAG